VVYSYGKVLISRFANGDGWLSSRLILRKQYVSLDLKMNWWE